MILAKTTTIKITSKINMFLMDNQMLVSQMNGSILPLIIIVIALVLIYKTIDNVSRKDQSEQ